MKEIVKHTFLLPKEDCYTFDEFTDDELRQLTSELTEKELQDPDARYRYLVPAPLSEEHKKALEKPMNIEDAFEIQDYGNMMNTNGYCNKENGYCVLPSGITYAAAMVKQMGRTDEMVEYYNKSFGLSDSLFYKLWYPNAHYMHFCDGACLEDFGFGRIKMKFTGQLDAKDLGIDIEEVRKKDPRCIYIGGTAAVGRNLDSEDPEKEEANIIMFYYRETDYGREARIRLFYGIGWKNGDFYLTVPDSKKAENIAKNTCTHIMQEYTNDEVLETTVYADYLAGRRQ